MLIPLENNENKNVRIPRPKGFPCFSISLQLILISMTRPRKVPYSIHPMNIAEQLRTQNTKDCFLWFLFVDSADVDVFVRPHDFCLVYPLYTTFEPFLNSILVLFYFSFFFPILFVFSCVFFYFILEKSFCGNFLRCNGIGLGFRTMTSAQLIGLQSNWVRVFI